VFGILNSFLSFLRTYEKKKAYNMFFMFDPRFKKLHLVSSYYVGKKQGVSIVEQYDRKALYSMLVTSYNHLHFIEDVAFDFVDRDDEEDYELDISKMTSNNVKTVKEIVTRELLDFRRFRVNMKDIKNPPQWWEKHESTFHIVGFLTKQILKIVGSQIETKHIFSLVGNLTCLKKISFII
jgi:hypothetical protein